MGYDAYEVLKRLLDVTVALSGLVLFSPVLVLISVALAVQYRGTPFFRHVRPGLAEQPFQLTKFKTMTDRTDGQGRPLPDAERITKLGSLLRSTSLDELPQLWNVLTGDMSLVGPRPLLFKYIPLYSVEQKLRHSVKPGITGWAQVNGRNSISWTRKFELDVYYVRHRSFSFDLKILWLTVLKVVRRDGINQSPSRPMQPFDGAN